MIKRDKENQRQNKLENIKADLVVVGGGLSGVCAAVQAAREGLQVTLVQDRPVLGGNASSEVRLWALGATSHMGSNNRWAREGGLINEILLDNLYRNKEGNPIIFDTVLLDKVYQEPNITLLLNTAVYEVVKGQEDTLMAVKAFCSQNSTEYVLAGDFFCDASGDGIVAFQSGASFRMGAEPASEFNEGFAPDVEDYGDLLGHSIYFYSKDTGKPVRFTPPSYALKDFGKLARVKNYNFNQHGCKLWWVEYGGRLDTVHQSEEIKMELWKVVYGIWDYIKNSGTYPEAANLTLEWVGTIPGKRESRRFEGDYMLNQNDIVDQKDYTDRVAFGGWAMDLHPADGIYSDKNSCTQWHPKGVYSIPYRCYYSKDVKNLFLAGRIISTTHVAFSSSRIMLTCAMGGQVVGTAAALCKRADLLPHKLLEPQNMQELQLQLNRTGQSIPRLALADPEDLVPQASITTNSELEFQGLAIDQWERLDTPSAQLIWLNKGVKYRFGFEVKALCDTQLEMFLMAPDAETHFSPQQSWGNTQFPLVKGEEQVGYEIGPLEKSGYYYVGMKANADVFVGVSPTRLPGLVKVYQKENKAVSNPGRQEPPKGIGIDAFDIYTPARYPEGKNWAFSVSPTIPMYGVWQIKNPYQRPTSDVGTNTWVANLQDEWVELELHWGSEKAISKVVLYFDGDFDNALESILKGHPDEVTPFVVREYEIINAAGQRVHNTIGNYQTINQIRFSKPINTKSLRFRFKRPSTYVPVAVAKIAVF